MNKKQNIIFNCVEITALLISTICFGLCIEVLPTLSNKEIFEKIILGVCLISNSVMISVEMIMFLIYQIKYRFIYILYIIADLILMVYINTIVPFSGIFVLLFFATVKLMVRLMFEEKIYVTNKLKKYQKIFKIKKKKKKVSVRKRTKQTKKVAVTKKENQVSRKKAIA